MKTQNLLKSILSVAVITVMLSAVPCDAACNADLEEARNQIKLIQEQAQNYVKDNIEKVKHQIGQIKDIIDNNNLLWSLIDSIWKSPDKSRAFVKKQADSQKLLRCGGEACTGDEARLKTSVTNNAQEHSITVGWGDKGYKYWFKVIYDAKDNFVTIDVNDLLGKN